MSGPDSRQQEQDERMFRLLAILQRVANGISTERDALELASELGLTIDYRPTMPSR